MDRKMFAKGIAILRASFPQSRAELDSDETIDVWFTLLKDLTNEQYIHGVTEVAQTCKSLLPSIAEIREVALGISRKDTEGRALNAWQKVKVAVRKAGYMRSVNFADDPVIHNVLQMMGGWKKFCLLEEEDERFYRPQFLKSYAAFARMKSQGKLQTIPFLPGEAEIYNIGHGHDKHIQQPMDITDDTVKQALAYNPQQQTALPEQVEVIPPAEAKMKFRTLVDALTHKSEEA